MAAIAWQAERSELGGRSLEGWLTEHYPTRANRDLLSELSGLGVPMTYASLEHKARRMGIKKECIILPGHVAPRFVMPEVAEDVDWRRVIDAAITLQEERKSIEFVDNLPATITIETDQPIALCFSADWHLGAGTTDHRVWRGDIEYLLKTPRLYYATVGDEINNVRSFKTLEAVISQVLPVDLQRKALEGVTRELVASGKLLFTTWGNHDIEFDERLLGESMLNELRRTQGVPHIGGIGLVRLRVGQVLYTILATHKARFRSSFNALHSAQRLYQLFYPADIVVSAHDHAAGFAAYEHYEMAREIGMGFGGTSYLIACSTYKNGGSNDWAARYYGKPVLRRETVVLWGDHHHIECFDDCQSAVARANSAE